MVVFNKQFTDLMGARMVVGKKLGVIFVVMVALSACNSPEELAQKNAEFQKKHFVGTNAAGKSVYKLEVFGDRVPRRENFLLGHTDETVRQIPVAELPKPEISGFSERFFQDWCERDGFQGFRVVNAEHNGNFRIQVSGGGRTYFPGYDLTAECV